MSTVACEAFCALLRAEREGLNARFEHSRREYPGLEGADFSAFLLQSANPLVEAVAALRPQSAADTARAAYDVGLDLVGQRLAGPKARTPWIDEAWRGLLCDAAQFVAEDPARYLGAMSNALHHLTSTPGARPQQWIEILRGVVPDAGDGATLLRLGQVAAWRCGLAHYRSAALEVADQLPEALALRVVGAPAGSAWAQLRAALAADPWFVPGEPTATAGPVARVGAYRGFGGLFVEPPRVAAQDKQLFVMSAAESWLLIADAFGATLHHSTEAEARTLRSAADRLPAEIVVPPGLGKVISIATTASTVAVSGELSHAVLLYARRPDS